MWYCIHYGLILYCFWFLKILHENITFIIEIFGGPLSLGPGPAPEMGPPFSVTVSCPWTCLVQTQLLRALLSRGRQAAGGHTASSVPLADRHVRAFCWVSRLDQGHDLRGQWRYCSGRRHLSNPHTNQSRLVLHCSRGQPCVRARSPRKPPTVVDPGPLEDRGCEGLRLTSPRHPAVRLVGRVFATCVVWISQGE